MVKTRVRVGVCFPPNTRRESDLYLLQQNTCMPLIQGCFFQPQPSPFWCIYLYILKFQTLGLQTRRGMYAPKDWSTGDNAWMAINACIVVLGFVMLMVSSAYADDHVVGDGSAWESGVDYGTWASTKTFKAGDTLTFKYGGLHSVYQVSKSDYQSCITGNAIAIDSSGVTQIKLSDPGTTYYFICGTVPHCLSGMKVSVTTASEGASDDGGSSATPPTVSSPVAPTGSFNKKINAATAASGPGSVVASILGLGLGLCLAMMG